MSDYKMALQEAATAWMSVSGLTDAWARAALKRMLDGEATEWQIAGDIYGILKPVSPSGRVVVPKIKDGRLSVRNLENATVPVDGAAAARSNLETLLFVYENRGLITEELGSFAAGDPRYRLYGLRTLVKERSD